MPIQIGEPVDYDPFKTESRTPKLGDPVDYDPFKVAPNVPKPEGVNASPMDAQAAVVPPPVQPQTTRELPEKASPIVSALEVVPETIGTVVKNIGRTGSPEIERIGTEAEQYWGAKPPVSKVLSDIPGGSEFITPKEGEPANFATRLKETTATELVPFVSSAVDIAHLTNIAAAGNRLRNNKETPEDLQLLKDFQDKQSRDTTFGYKVADVLAQLPAFAGELWATGGIGGAATKASRGGIKKGVEWLLEESGKELLEKRLGQTGLKMASNIAGRSVQTVPAGALRTVAEAKERQLPQVDVEIDEQGVPITGKIANDGTPAFEAWRKAAANQWVQVVSEFSGGLLPEIGKYIPAQVFNNAVVNSLKKLNPTANSAILKKVAEKTAWHGVWGEMFEERMGEIGNAFLGVEDFKLPSPEQLAVEFVAFSIPGVAGNMLEKIAGKEKSKKQSALFTEAAYSPYSPDMTVPPAVVPPKHAPIDLTGQKPAAPIIEGFGEVGDKLAGRKVTPGEGFGYAAREKEKRAWAAGVGRNLKDEEITETGYSDLAAPGIAIDMLSMKPTARSVEFMEKIAESRQRDQGETVVPVTGTAVPPVDFEAQDIERQQMQPQEGISVVPPALDETQVVPPREFTPQPPSELKGIVEKAREKQGPRQPLSMVKPYEAAVPALEGEVIPPAVKQNAGALPNIIEGEATTEDQELSREIDKAAYRAEMPKSEAQAKAANNKQGAVIPIQGLNFRAETPRGMFREGVNKETGEKWRTQMVGAHYGKLIDLPGADGQAMDAFIGPKPTSPTVYVVNQVNPKTKAPDEHKVMIGYNSLEAAKNAYFDHYAKGWQGFGGIVPMTPEQLKTWATKENVKKPAPALLAPEAQKALPAPETAVPTAEKLTKELWEMTQGEYIQRYISQRPEEKQQRELETELDNSLGSKNLHNMPEREVEIEKFIRTKSISPAKKEPLIAKLKQANALERQRQQVREDLKARHRMDIEKAVQEGRAVPAEVLAEYPNLQKQPAAAVTSAVPPIPEIPVAPTEKAAGNLPEIKKELERPAVPKEQPLAEMTLDDITDELATGNASILKYAKRAVERLGQATATDELFNKAFSKAIERKTRPQFLSVEPALRAILRGESIEDAQKLITSRPEKKEVPTSKESLTTELFSSGSTVRVGKSPEVHAIVRQLEPTPAEKELGELYFEVKDSKGEVATFEKKDLKPIKVEAKKEEPKQTIEERKPVIRRTLHSIESGKIKEITKDELNELYKQTKQVKPVDFKEYVDGKLKALGVTIEGTKKKVSGPSETRLRKMVESQKAKFVDIQEDFDGNLDIVMFMDPQIETTLAIPYKGITVQKIKARLQESRGEFAKTQKAREKVVEPEVKQTEKPGEFVSKVQAIQENTDRLLKEENYTISNVKVRSEKGEAALFKRGFRPYLWDETTGKLKENLLGVWAKKPATAKEKIHDQENISRIPSEKREGKEPVKAESVGEKGREEIKAGRVLQASEIDEVMGKVSTTLKKLVGAEKAFHAKNKDHALAFKFMNEMRTALTHARLDEKGAVEQAFNVINDDSEIAKKIRNAALEAVGEKPAEAESIFAGPWFNESDSVETDRAMDQSSRFINEKVNRDVLSAVWEPQVSDPKPIDGIGYSSKENQTVFPIGSKFYIVEREVDGKKQREVFREISLDDVEPGNPRYQDSSRKGGIEQDVSGGRQTYIKYASPKQREKFKADIQRVLSETQAEAEKPAKEPWEMTLLEYAKSRVKPSIAAQLNSAEQAQSFKAQYRKEIQAAIDAGKTVPNEVLSELPDLQEKYGKKKPGGITEPTAEPDIAQTKKPWEMTREEFDKDALYQGVVDPDLKSDYWTDLPNMGAHFAEQQPARQEPNKGRIRIALRSQARGITEPTRNEFKAREISTIAELSAGEVRRGAHRAIVEKARSEGKPVPENVLKEYGLSVPVPPEVQGVRGAPEKAKAEEPARPTKVEEPAYTPPEGTTARTIPVRSIHDKEKWVLKSVSEGTTFGKMGTYEEARVGADKENQRLAEYDKAREKTEAGFKKLEWGRDKEGYLRTITSSAGVGRFFRQFKEVAWIDQPYKKQEAVYFQNGKLVRIGKGQDHVTVHEVPIADISGWKDTKVGKAAQEQFVAKVETAKPTIESVKVKGGAVAEKAKAQIAELEKEYEILAGRYAKLNTRYSRAPEATQNALSKQRNSVSDQMEKLRTEQDELRKTIRRAVYEDVAARGDEANRIAAQAILDKKDVRKEVQALVEAEIAKYGDIDANAVARAVDTVTGLTIRTPEADKSLANLTGIVLANNLSDRAAEIIKANYGSGDIRDALYEKHGKDYEELQRKGGSKEIIKRLNNLILDMQDTVKTEQSKLDTAEKAKQERDAQEAATAEERAKDIPNYKHGLTPDEVKVYNGLSQTALDVLWKTSAEDLAAGNLDYSELSGKSPRKAATNSLWKKGLTDELGAVITDIGKELIPKLIAYHEARLKGIPLLERVDVGKGIFEHDGKGWKLVKGLKGEKWYSNGHVAIEGEPKAGSLLNERYKENPAELKNIFTKETHVSVQPAVFQEQPKAADFVYFSGAENPIAVDANYYDFITNTFPNATWTAQEKAPLTPLNVYQGDKLVAIAMPVNTKSAITPQIRVLTKRGKAAEKEAEKPIKAVAIQKEEETIQDFGEKIGGARKDTAERGYEVGTKAKIEETGPVWKKRFIVAESTYTPGQFKIIDTKEGRFSFSSGGQTFSSKEDAEKAIPIYAVAKTHHIYENSDKTFSIYKRVGERKRFKVVNQDFASREDAMRYMAQNAEKILNTKTTFGEEILPVPEIAIRKGEERRTGPATPEMFMDTFAPRGIEFGNWNNQEERQQVMNHAYDGLLDLATVLNVPPKALMLNGELAIAFGARGQGLVGAKAHYEPDYGVINLTKMKGAGSLAHEWLHALDHYLGRLDTKASAEKEKNRRGDMVYKTKGTADMLSQGISYKSQVRPEVQEAYKTLIETMYKKAEQYVEDTKQAEKFVGTARENLKESLNGIRNNLAKDLVKDYTWRKNKRGLSPASAEQLAEFDKLASILTEGGDLETKYVPGNPKAPANTRAAMLGRRTNDTLEGMSSILKAVRNYNGFTTDNQGILDRVRANMSVYSARLKMLEDAKGGTEKTKQVPTSFAMEAKKMDQARTGDYWSEPHEMAARAFAAYVEDKVAEQGGQSDFLVYHAHGGILIPMIDGFVARPYPEGKERIATNEAFDKFIKSLKTKETEKGTTLYSRANRYNLDKAIKIIEDTFGTNVRIPAAINKLQGAVKYGTISQEESDHAVELLTMYAVDPATGKAVQMLPKAKTLEILGKEQTSEKTSRKEAVSRDNAGVSGDALSDRQRNAQDVSELRQEIAKNRSLDAEEKRGISQMVPLAILSEDQHKITGLVSKFTKKRIVWVDRAFFEGVVIDKDRIYISSRATSPQEVFRILFHEFGHIIGLTGKDNAVVRSEYEKFIADIKAVITPAQVATYRRTRNIAPGMDEEGVWREYGSDILADAMRERSFYERLYERSPESFQMLVDWFMVALKKMGFVSKDLKPSLYYTPAQAHRLINSSARLVDAYLKEMQSGVSAGEQSPQYSKAQNADIEADVQAIAKEYGLDVSKPEDRITAVDEFIARKGEDLLRDRNIIQKIVAAVRQALRDMGFTIEFSENDILSMAGAALKTEGMGDQIAYSFAGKSARGFEKARGRFTDLADRQERFEISDEGAKIKNHGGWLSVLTNAQDERVPLSRILDHPDLYAQYPEAKNMMVQLRSWRESGKTSHASYNPETNVLEVARDIGQEAYGKTDFKKIVLHEIQHAIQEKEGFAKGGGLEIARNLPEYQEAIQAAREYKGSGKTPPGWASVETLPERGDDLNLIADRIYRRLAGEEEARRVSARAGMIAAERLGTPYERTDLGEGEERIVRREGGVANSEEPAKIPLMTPKEGAGDIPAAKTPQPEAGTYYHGTTQPEGKEFAPNSLGLVFISPDKKEAGMFANAKGGRVIGVRLKEGARIFDPRNENDLSLVGATGEDRLWDARNVETADWVNKIKDAGFDGFITRDQSATTYGTDNIALFGKSKIDIPTKKTLEPGSGELKQAERLTFEEFKNAVERGVNHQATGKVLPGEELAATPLRMGLINGYSIDDIAHFYASRRGYGSIAASEIYDPIRAGFEEFKEDAAKELANIPTGKTPKPEGGSWQDTSKWNIPEFKPIDNQYDEFAEFFGESMPDDSVRNQRYAFESKRLSEYNPPTKSKFIQQENVDEISRAIIALKEEKIDKQLFDKVIYGNLPLPPKDQQGIDVIGDVPIGELQRWMGVHLGAYLDGKIQDRDVDTNELRYYPKQDISQMNLKPHSYPGGKQTWNIWTGPNTAINFNTKEEAYQWWEGHKTGKPVMIESGAPEPGSRFYKDNPELYGQLIEEFRKDPTRLLRSIWEDIAVRVGEESAAMNEFMRYYGPGGEFTKEGIEKKIQEQKEALKKSFKLIKGGKAEPSSDTPRSPKEGGQAAPSRLEPMQNRKGESQNAERPWLDGETVTELGNDTEGIKVFGRELATMVPGLDIGTDLSEVSLHGPNSDALQRIAQGFKKQVLFFRSTNDDVKLLYSGATLAGDNKTVWINVDKARDLAISLMSRYVEGKLETRPSENPAIQFSKVRGAKAASAITATENKVSWDAPEMSKLDTFIYTIQDKQVDTKRIQDAIAKQIGEIDDEVNAYQKEELFHKRAVKRVKDFLELEQKPLIEDMQKRGVQVDEFEHYLHARHAEEANKVVAERNPDMPDGGSGMMTQDARDYMAGLSPEKKGHFEALAKRVDAMVAKTRKTLVDYGVEAPGTIKTWEGAYDSYIPLHREDMDNGTGLGQGYSVKGPSTKERVGSKRKVVDILANIAIQREKAVVRGEKNRVSTALMSLAKLNPNPDFWKVDVPPMLKKVEHIRYPWEVIKDNDVKGAFLTKEDAQDFADQTPNSKVKKSKTPYTEQRVADVVDPMYKNRENVVMTRIYDAKADRIIEHAVVFNEFNERAMRMAQALKNLDVDQIGYFLGLSAKATRYFASINTQFNPVFGVVNLIRDFQGALFNLSNTPIAGKQMEVTQHTISALRGIYSDLRAHRKGQVSTSKWAQLWEEFQNEGGTTGYRDMFATAKDRTDALKRELNPDKWMDSPLGRVFTADGKLKVPISVAMEKAKGVFGWLSDYNETMENAVRLASYKVARDSGLSKERAASIAKNLTVNFNRKGQVARQAGALYAFFNASVQGGARMIETFRGPMGKTIIRGGILAGVVQAIVLAATGFDDDEPPEFVRERNLLIPIGGKRYISIPMPLGFNILPNIGRIGTEYALSGFKDAGKRGTDLIGLFADTFNPIGGSGLSMQTFAPTVLDPIAALAENKDWTGKPIARPNYNTLNPIPGHARAKDASSSFSRSVSRALNWITGGTEYKPGMVSPTPDQIDFLIGQVTGGIGREVNKAITSTESIVSGEEIPAYKIPLFGRLYGNAADQSSEGNKFYQNIIRLNEHENEIKGRRKDGKPVAEYLKDNPEARYFKIANKLERVVHKLQDRRRRMVEKNASKESVKAIDKLITQRMKTLNDLMEKATK